MERVITRVYFNKPLADNRKRVAAYARVSSSKEEMLHSLSAQVSYYSALIQKRLDWKFCGVYADEGISGTKDTREEFQRLLADCRAGKIDMVITKSISRFARNTVTLLKTVRELKDLGIDVYFEEQNIHSMSANGELILTFLASYAQEESLSVSENQKWKVKKNFEAGLPWNCTMLGYRRGADGLVVKQDEKEEVAFIFNSFMQGKGIKRISDELNAQGIKTRYGKAWCKSSIRRVLQNYAYTGNLMLQTSYNENHISKKKMENTGQLPKYYVEGSHEAIVSLELFQEVQKELEERANKHCKKGNNKKVYPFTGLLHCGTCGDCYRRKVTKSRVVYVCETYNSKGKASCASKAIPEEILKSIVTEITGEQDFTYDKIRKEIQDILIFCDYILVRLYDGTEKMASWKPLSRKNSWTPEMKEKARQREMLRQRSK